VLPIQVTFIFKEVKYALVNCKRVVDSVKLVDHMPIVMYMR